MEENNIKVFIDHVGHTTVSEILETKNNLLKAKNPAVLVASPNNSGQLSVQLIPVFFKEFISIDKRENGSVFYYPIDKIVCSDIELDARLVEQYVNMFQTQKKQEPADPPVIKLFDEE
jgi:hypothetical protein